MRGLNTEIGHEVDSRSGLSRGPVYHQLLIEFFPLEGFLNRLVDGRMQGWRTAFNNTTFDGTTSHVPTVRQSRIGNFGTEVYGRGG
jgi:hypothetical protein